MTGPRLLDSLSAVSERGGAVCIGNFDGVHQGHRMLLRRTRALADELDAPLVVVTFFPPSRVLFEGATFLSTPEEKLVALADFAPDVVVNLRFDRALASTDKAVWLAELAGLAPGAIVVGEDFRFGRGRQGGLEDLREITPRLEAFPLLELDGAPVKSSAIRDHLTNGDVEAAARLLGAPYLVRGVVGEGQRRGRTIGYPTANLAVPEGKALPQGVFAVTVARSDQVFGGMANAGPRPTFAGEAPALEVHLFDFEGDLLGAQLDVRFLARLRRPRRFAGLDELKAQLAADEAAARRALLK